MPFCRYYSICLIKLSLFLFIPFFISPFNYAQDDTLALAGSTVISTGDFSARYKEKIVKTGITDNYDTRYKYLLNIINDELLIAEAKNKGYDRTYAARKELERIKIQELLNSYSLKHISPSLNITDDDLKLLYIKLNTHVKVSHLYAPTKDAALELYKRLQAGEKFEDLAKECFTNPVLKNSGGALGYISVDETDPDFEKAAFSMHPGEISKPVKTVQGYSIIRVEDIITNPLTTESEFLKAYDRLYSFERKRKFEEAAKNYAASLNAALNVKFNDNTLSFLFSKAFSNGIRDLQELPGSFTAAELKMTLLTSSMGKWSLKNVLDEMSLTSDKQKKFIRSEENLKDFISGLVNRKYITGQAVKEKLDKQSGYIKNVNFNFGTWLLTCIENEVKSSVTISPDSILSYYNNNKNKFYTEPLTRLSSILVDNAAAADTVKLLLLSGDAFDKLAEKYSLQSVTARQGGDMGYFKKAELENISEQVFGLRTGEWAGPFEQDGKYVFLKCTGYNKAALKPFEQCAGEIKETLEAFEWYRVRDSYTENLKKKYPVIIKPEKLHAPDLLTKS